MFTEQDAIRWIEQGKNETVGKLVTVLYEQQTLSEQASQFTHVVNNRGFNKFDAKFGSELAQKFAKYHTLTDGQANAARQMLRKYRKQLATLANEKAAN